jgi:hypothetical protein
MLALSAMSLAFHHGVQSVYALEYYTTSIKTLSNLQSEQELAFNGQFLTHFLLLIYEVNLYPT